MTKFRTRASLLASGIATITLDQGRSRLKVMSTKKALMADKKAITADGRRAIVQAQRYLERAS